MGNGDQWWSIREVVGSISASKDRVIDHSLNYSRSIYCITVLKKRFFLSTLNAKENIEGY